MDDRTGKTFSPGETVRLKRGAISTGIDLKKESTDFLRRIEKSLDLVAACPGLFRESAAKQLELVRAELARREGIGAG